MKNYLQSKGKLRLLSLIVITAALTISMVLMSAGAEQAYAAGTNEIKAGDHITMGKVDAAGYDGIPYWRVLDVEDDGALLLMSEYLWTGDGGSDADAEVKFDSDNKINSWQASDARNWCKAFADAVLTDIPGVTVLETTKSDDAYTYTYGKYTNYIFYSSDNILNNDKVFFLSAEEVVKYMPEPAERIAYKKDGTTTGLWLLRSALWKDNTDSGYSNRVGEILKGTGTSGAMNAVSSWTGTPARPAFRCSLSPDLCIAGTEKDGSTDWTIAAEKHDLGAPEYSWSEDDSECTASAVCSICGDTVRETVCASEEVTEEPTAEKEGSKTLTAEFSISGFETQIKTVSIPKKEEPSTDDQDKPSGKPDGDDANKPSGDDAKKQADDSAKKASDNKADAKARKVKTVTVNVKTVNTKAINKAVRKAGGSRKYVTKIVLGRKVRKISAGAFRKYKKVKTVELRTRKLTKKSVRKSLKGSKVRKVRVRISKKAKVNKKYVRKYKKIFTRKNAGRKTAVK